MTLTIPARRKATRLDIALASYAHACDVVNNDAARIIARNDVTALAGSYDVDTLIDSYMHRHRATKLVTTVTWECGDVVEVRGGENGSAMTVEARAANAADPVTAEQIAAAVAARSAHIYA